MFQNIIGHQEVINYLTKLDKNSNFPQSYLFYGSEAIGKKIIAFEFAKYINKTEILSSDILYYLSPDDFTSDLININAIRNIKHFLSFKSGEFYKFVIIDDFEKMRPEVINTLLKILEEPPQKSIIILLTSKIDSILPTIISRCQLVRFKAPKNEEIFNYFNNIWKRDFDLEEILKIFPHRVGLISNLNSDDMLWQIFLKTKDFFDKFLKNAIWDNFIIIKDLINIEMLDKNFVLLILLALLRKDFKQNPGQYFKFKPLFDTIYFYFKTPQLNFELLLNTLACLK